MIEDPAYGQLKNHLIACTGLAYYCDRDHDLTERIGRRLSELGLPDCAAYSRLLADEKAGASELEVMVSRLNIGETYFFRDREQFDAIRDVVLPEILERKKLSRQLRIWSAGCSNGAEPYSLAILLGRELMHNLDGWQVSILATDINPRALTDAAEGRFGEWSLRSTPDDVRRLSFSNEGSQWIIHSKYKEPISFVQMNLVEDESSSSWKETTGFDLILCRNVMIYFAPEVRARLIGQFHTSLAVGGWFLVGAVEHDMVSFSAFQAVRAPGATLYQKQEVQRISAPQPFTCPFAATPSALASIPKPDQPKPDQPAERPNIDGLRQLANRGEWKNAVRYFHRLPAQNAVAHFYHAVVLEQMGIPEEAEKSLRQAIYLDRNFLMAHHLLGLTLTKEKEVHEAALSFRNVLDLSLNLPDDEFVVEGAGMTVAELKGLARMQLHSLSMHALGTP